MVAKITVPSTIKKALNYNEQKVREGKAEFIYAANFLRNSQQLNFFDKLRRFEDLISLNQRAQTNTVHISLNFAEHEKLETEKLTAIASTYMAKIGFADQPYLVYKHLDAGHPHVHIVTTNIQSTGKRISIHNLGKNESAKARREIENDFKLVRAENHTANTQELKPLGTTRLSYGQHPTKRGISNVIGAVIPHYKFSSLSELNAILKLYNVVADPGKEGGWMQNKKGLVFRVLDERGKSIGVPIKASSFHSKPTLKNLERRFKENELEKDQYKMNLRRKIDWLVTKPMSSIADFKQALEKEKISLVLRQNENGRIYGLTYVDHSTKCVFNGSDLGKQYSANSILASFGKDAEIISQKEEPKKAATSQLTIKEPEKLVQQGRTLFPLVLNDIMKPEEGISFEPRHLKPKKKKKTRRQ